MAKQSNKPQAPKAPSFVQVHYSELAGETLAYAVAEILGTAEDEYSFNDDGTITNIGKFAPQDNWQQAKPLFEDYAPSFSIHRIGGMRSYYAVLANSKVAQVVGANGPDHAVALLRAIVLSGLDAEDGGLIAVPEQFLPSQLAALAIERGDKQGALNFDTGPQDIAQVPASSTPTGRVQVQSVEHLKQLVEDSHKRQPGSATATPTKAQEAPQDDKGGKGDATPQGKAQDKPAAQEKPASGKPAPQGKHAQAMKDHGKPQGDN